jgi:hypothetical protein
MGAIGRNDRCPCGSGKKYKKCHGLSGGPSGLNVAATTSVDPDHPMTGSLPPKVQSTEVALAGFPGQQEHWVLVHKFKPEAEKASSPAGHPGEYRVVFVLSRPGHALRRDRDISFDLSSAGDSHISLNVPQVPVPGVVAPITTIQIEAVIKGRTLHLEAYPNDRGFISRIEATVQAESFAEADEAVSRALTPYLSMWSATLNVPAHVYRIEITETRTQNRRVTLTMPFYEAPLIGLPEKAVTEEYLWFAALYREAVNSNSPLYRFLCLYKIIEGVVVRRAVTKTYPRDERVPKDPAEFNDWLNALFPVRPERWDDMALDSVFIPEVRGRTVGDIREKDLRPLRNDVGHMFDDSDKTHRLWIDDPKQVRRVHHWLPVTTCIARLMMKNDFPEQFLPGLAEHDHERPVR